MPVGITAPGCIGPGKANLAEWGQFICPELQGLFWEARLLVSAARTQPASALAKSGTQDNIYCQHIVCICSILGVWTELSNLTYTGQSLVPAPSLHLPHPVCVCSASPSTRQQVIVHADVIQEVHKDILDCAGIKPRRA